MIRRLRANHLLDKAQTVELHSLQFVCSKRFISNKNTQLGNLYGRLGVSNQASSIEIKTAYYKLSKIYHPDKNDGCTDAALKFREITEAYEILGNAISKKKYDRESPYGKAMKRPRYNKKSATEYNDRDRAFEEKIRLYRQRARHDAWKTIYANPRQRVYNYDAWFNAHFGSGPRSYWEPFEKTAEKVEFSKVENNLNTERCRIRPAKPLFEDERESEAYDDFYSITEMNARKAQMKEELKEVAVLIAVAVGIIAFILGSYKLISVEPTHKKQSAMPEK